MKARDDWAKWRWCPTRRPSPASGLLFYNTLFDENAASHIALGQSYSGASSAATKPDAGGARTARGANASLIHVDWMIGSEEMDIDGITAAGKAEPLMRQGEWV